MYCEDYPGDNCEDCNNPEVDKISVNYSGITSTVYVEKFTFKLDGDAKIIAQTHPEKSTQSKPVYTCSDPNRKPAYKVQILATNHKMTCEEITKKDKRFVKALSEDELKQVEVEHYNFGGKDWYQYVLPLNGVEDQAVASQKAKEIRKAGLKDAWLTIYGYSKEDIVDEINASPKAKLSKRQKGKVQDTDESVVKEGFRKISNYEGAGYVGKEPLCP
jgi:hypothetical protein